MSQVSTDLKYILRRLRIANYDENSMKHIVKATIAMKLIENVENNLNRRLHIEGLARIAEDFFLVINNVLVYQFIVLHKMVFNF